MIRWLAVAGSVAAGGQGRAATIPASAPIVWRLEGLRTIGGRVPEVLGAPRVTPEGALRFNGIDDGLILNDVPLAGRAAFTVEALIAPNAGGAAEQRFLHIEDARGNRATMEIRVAADGRWALDTFLLCGGQHRSLLDRHRLHPAGRWTWVALRYDGGTMSSFVDGIEELAGSVEIAPFAVTGRTAVGVRLNRVCWFKGEIKELRFHGRALTAAELQRMR